MSRSAHRTILITGGDKGIGAHIARAFHAAGDRVVIASRTDSGLAKKLGSRAFHVRCDVTRCADLRRVCEKAAGDEGRIDVLVNNAGFSEWRAMERVDEAFWDRMLDVNLKAVFFATQAALGFLGRGGAVVNVSSLAGKRGSANNAVYCASKFALNGLTQAAAKELGSRGIRVNAVCPVYVETEGLLEALGSKESPAAGASVKKYLASFAKSQSALGRLPEGGEIAQACLFLASPAASAITGQCLNIDCGVLPQ